MSTSRFAVALCAGFCASTASVWPSLFTGPSKPGAATPPAVFPAAAQSASPAEAWPPAGAVPSKRTPDVKYRLERTANGARRLVVEKTGTFMHLQYRDVASAGPDWASIELRPGDRAPKGDVAVFESTDPRTLATSRGVVSFSLAEEAPLSAYEIERVKEGPRSDSALRTCQSIESVGKGYVVFCSIPGKAPGVRAIRPTSAHPLEAAWVWDVPRAGKLAATRFVRIDLPLQPGGAESGAIAFVHGGKGVVIRADATWPSASEPQALLFTEASRTQPVSPFFSWAAPTPATPKKP
ncbi:MAG: hypothetical protein U0441_21225 [Polyangiaceae bacterium]